MAFITQALDSVFLLVPGPSKVMQKMAAGETATLTLCHPDDPANPPDHHLTAHQECVETRYWKLNTHTAQLPVAASNVLNNSGIDSDQRWSRA